MEEKNNKLIDSTPAPAGVEESEPDEGRVGRAAQSASASARPSSKRPLKPESRQELEQFVQKYRPFIDDPSLLDQPMRMVAEFFREVAIEEGVIGE